jgi:hypothetical protein
MKKIGLILCGTLAVAGLLVVLYVARPSSTAIKKVDGIPLWEISGISSDERREFSGTLKASKDGAVQVVLARLIHVSKGSPTSSSRHVTFLLHCHTSEPIPLNWYLRRERGGPLENQSSLGCEDHYQVFLAAGFADIYVVLRLPAGFRQPVKYTLTAQVTGAY